jgi:hypothetical protein
MVRVFLSQNMYLLYSTSVVVHVSYLNKGKNINHQKYIKDCSRLFASTLKEQSKGVVQKNLKFHHEKERPHVLPAFLKNILDGSIWY